MMSCKARFRVVLEEPAPENVVTIVVARGVQ